MLSGFGLTEQVQPEDSKNVPRGAVLALELDAVHPEIQQMKKQLLERRQKAGWQEPCTYFLVSSIYEERVILIWLTDLLNSKDR